MSVQQTMFFSYKNTKNVYWAEEWDIVLEVTTDSSNQKIGINKYFNVDNYVIERWDWTSTIATWDSQIGNHSKTYANAWVYKIILKNPDGCSRRKFKYTSYGLVCKKWFTWSNVKVVYMPPLKWRFWEDDNNVWDYFFENFNHSWALTFLPDWSFDTSDITSTGDRFFEGFNWGWKIMSLPVWSFDLSNISVVWDFFFFWFNGEWKMISLPAWSFNTSNITTNWINFFYLFNYNWKITKANSWTWVKIKNITNSIIDFYYRDWSATQKELLVFWDCFEYYEKD